MTLSGVAQNSELDYRKMYDGSFALAQKLPSSYSMRNDFNHQLTSTMQTKMNETSGKIVCGNVYCEDSAIFSSNMAVKRVFFLSGEGKGCDYKRSLTQSGVTIGGVRLYGFDQR